MDRKPTANFAIFVLFVFKRHGLRRAPTLRSAQPSRSPAWVPTFVGIRGWWIALLEERKALSMDVTMST